MPCTSEIFKKYVTDTFVETGSLIGDGIEAALKAGFERVYSIELSDKYYNYCINRFKGNQRVTLIKGDSGIILFEAAKDIKNKIAFWLDGHHSCGDTALGSSWSPLMLELEQIGRLPLKNHTLIIDDMRCWDKNNPVIGFGLEEIKQKILSINSSYNFYYEDGFEKNDILVAVAPY